MNKLTIAALFLTKKLIFLALLYMLSGTAFGAEKSLHNGTVADWKVSILDVRLATSADWFVAVTKSQNKKIQRELDLLPVERYIVYIDIYSATLEGCITNILKDHRLYSDSDSIAELASLCYVSTFGID